jgi:hypothetical protein
MFIVTVKSIDADSFASPALYGETTMQKYNFSFNPQGGAGFFYFRAESGRHVMPTAGRVSMPAWFIKGLSHFLH